VNYFNDFGDRTLQAINVNLLRQAWTKYNTSWQGGNLEAMLRVQRYQTLEDPLIPADQPYARVPQLTLVANQQLPAGFSFNLQGDLTRFSHPTLQTGDRFVAYPSVTWNLLDKSWGFFRPKFGVNYTKYDLNPLGNNTTPGSTITRTLPIFSTDSGLPSSATPASMAAIMWKRWNRACSTFTSRPRTKARFRTLTVRKTTSTSPSCSRKTAFPAGTASMPPTS
jgi:LPS-assembly protein